MTDSQWVKIPGGNWLRFDPLTDDDMEAVVKRLDGDYLPADLAARYAEAWIDVARLISTLAAIQSLVALQVEGAAPRAEGGWGDIEDLVPQNDDPWRKPVRAAQGAAPRAKGRLLDEAADYIAAYCLPRPRRDDLIARLRAAPRAEGLDPLFLMDDTFAQAVENVFAAPGDTDFHHSPAHGYYHGDTHHFIDLLRAEYARLSRPSDEREREEKGS